MAGIADKRWEIKLLEWLLRTASRSVGRSPSFDRRDREGSSRAARALSRAAKLNLIGRNQPAPRGRLTQSARRFRLLSRLTPPQIWRWRDLDTCPFFFPLSSEWRHESRPFLGARRLLYRSAPEINTIYSN
ncbi:hypothetical protein EVAR_22728_1 [Eumeta japonica]|uniref:Uncharacterized protein n=1 Tax=Eumeta variegata TaxID=151549 RepID=A0A4C1UTP0_EUMVA|nr:hypothetical protein EVAR_22728_1 [Eumeta japonica]